MKATFIIVICLGQWPSMAQVNTTWKGVTPGMECSWHCPQNWTNNHTPDIFSNVVIPDVLSQNGCFPIIGMDAGSINSLTIESGGKLTISKSGALVIGMPESSLIVGQLINHGKILWMTTCPKATKKYRDKKSVASRVRQYSIVLYATDTFDW